MRPSVTLSHTLLALTLVAGSALAQPAARGSVLPPTFDRIEAGAPTPVAHRPPVPHASLRNRVMGLQLSEPAPTWSEPTEYSVIFQYDGMRSDLERAGVRVQSQVGSTWTARVRREEIGNLRGVSGLRNVRLARYMQPHLNTALPDTRGDLEHAPTATIPPRYQGRAGKGILIGDVDTGIDFTASDFADSTGKTRILYIWDQNDLVGPSPSGFGYGSEWTKSQIDNSPGTIRHQDTNGHGTNVGGVLVGNGSQTGCSQPAYRYIGMAPEAQIVEVATDFSDAGIIDGVNYVFQKAAALGMDCVVNLSLGGQFGPHDGSSDFSKAIGALTGPGKIVVASSGNNESDNIHGRLTTTSTTVGTDKFTINVPAYTAAGGTFNDYFLITGWVDPTASVTIRVKGPSAADTLSVGFGDTKDRNLTIASGKGGKLFIANQNAFYGITGTTTTRQFEIEVYDSLSTSPPRNGTWEIDVVPNGAASIGKRVDIWIYADNLGLLGAVPTVVTGLNTGTMVGEPADADSVIAVGAHATKSSWFSCAQGGTCAYTTPPTLGAIASFSNIGPRRDGVQKPELTAPGFGVATTHSTASGMGVCADVDDGVHELTQGTSFSAPLVSGAVALFLQYQPGSSPSKVRQTFEQHARTDAFTGAVPNATWGYGKLDVYATIDHVLPTCAVTSPVGGESWAGNSSQTVTWTASDNVAVTTVDVAYSLHGAGGPWVAIATGVANTGSTPWTTPSSVTDSALVRVTAHDAGNNAASAQSAALFHLTSSTGVGPSGPAAFWLAPPVPNPSSRTVAIQYSLSRPGDARVDVYGLRGERVWSQSMTNLNAGVHSLNWSGRSSSGHAAGSGLYFLRLTTNEGVRTTRLIRLD